MLLILLLFFLFLNSNVTISATKAGLSLWYQNIIPALLPSMLLSTLFISRYKVSNKKNLYIIIIVIGLFCGCPVGAKTISHFYNTNVLNKNEADILLSLCNNLSLTYISGYIYTLILRKSISLSLILFLIYFPSILITIFRIIASKSIHKKQPVTPASCSYSIMSPYTEESNLLLQCIINITYIGIYIIICTNIIFFINNTTFINNDLKFILNIPIEITNSCHIISDTNFLENSKKIALILSITSFGGICSILQTKKVIDNTGLSIYKYTIYKLLNAFSTYCAAILLI